ncbi:hypothetical protein K0M31_002287 [Melipona bicolor]|uniref:Uncharacterized protein n=1 Tax=Melipona bicolor TaxID=60889 RepID=A0AA40KYQ5_9HYME|nr:hypothetical protein K0M31_002287 [Melipona bicolor]
MNIQTRHSAQKQIIELRIQIKKLRVNSDVLNHKAEAKEVLNALANVKEWYIVKRERTRMR